MAFCITFGTHGKSSCLDPRIQKPEWTLSLTGIRAVDVEDALSLIEQDTDLKYRVLVSARGL